MALSLYKTMNKNMYNLQHETTTTEFKYPDFK